MTVKAPETSLPSGMKRILEVVYAVEGVVAARVWQSPGKVAVGVHGRADASPAELLRRVESAVIGLRDPDTTWDFGWLEEP